MRRCRWPIIGGPHQPKGHGHMSFFLLGRKLRNAGMGAHRIATTLQAEVPFARSPRDRKAQIPSIIETLTKSKTNMRTIAKFFARSANLMLVRTIYGMTERRGGRVPRSSQADKLEGFGLPRSPCARSKRKPRSLFVSPSIRLTSDSVEKLSAGRAQLRPFRFQTGNHSALIRD
jgi:hypothetical protein